ncbi:ABC transporter ATP-binding protein [Magnetovibrio sp.]|uniref:ABC transporter ATP-binding protein n=1 Tax=Magnetovibrio sp. TaxID=2024836 RepID=UPI002F9442B1
MTSGLVMERIRHAFGAAEVLKDVSLVAEAGKLTCLLGPSGCGKTTLLRLAAGLETVQNGRVYLQGKMVANGHDGMCLPPEQRGIGLMFQDYALFPHLSVYENIAFGIKDLTSERRQWIEAGLERMGVAKHRNSYPHVLSGGQQQRVALLRALAPEPQVLLLDEPFSGLDVTRRAQVREDTLNFLKECGVAVLMVTHDPEEAMFMADHIVVMKSGKVVQAGTPVQIYFHPNDAFVAELFGPMNHFEGVVDKGQLQTPFGPFPIPSIPDGQHAQVLVRMEGIRVTMGANHEAPEGCCSTTGRIEEAYLLGRSSHLHILVPRTPRSATDEVRLHVRVPGVMKPEEGAAVSVWADPKQVFAFAIP